ncbi:hypothetical protein PENPOL_c002G00189 [Penicillium polonicum]|uniref:Uncharacterized protein n=1 Tax=Penicillium polonicum TaxID=60169 RepID=A0A1V6NWR6_PENPO|nr:hypothetical protein PENPOL_c002G00189 [Penicillium polonicum]
MFNYPEHSPSSLRQSYSIFQILQTHHRTPVSRSGPVRIATRRTAQSTSRTGTKQYILASAGLGTPLPSPIIHGVYYGIRTTATGQTGANLEVAAASGVPKDSSRYGKTRKSTVYISPRPLLGHRPPRYFFTLIALTESINGSKLSPCVRPSDDARENGGVSPFGIWSCSLAGVVTGFVVDCGLALLSVVTW